MKLSGIFCLLLYKRKTDLFCTFSFILSTSISKIVNSRGLGVFWLLVFLCCIKLKTNKNMIDKLDSLINDAKEASEVIHIESFKINFIDFNKIKNYLTYNEECTLFKYEYLIFYLLNEGSILTVKEMSKMFDDYMTSKFKFLHTGVGSEKSPFIDEEKRISSLCGKIRTVCNQLCDEGILVKSERFNDITNKRSYTYKLKSVYEQVDEIMENITQNIKS